MTHLIEKPVIETDDRFGRRVARRRNRDPHRQYVIGAETQVHSLKRRDTADEQTGADEQHHGERRLRDDERGAKALS